MYYEKLDILLIILVSMVPLGFFTTYTIAVLNDHVEPGFPYISDTGTLSPESCIFGQILAVGSFLTFIVVYIRYHHVTACIKTYSEFSFLERPNFIGYIFGLLSCLGVSLVGNFQETNVSAIHFIGAGLAFVGLFVYCSFQTYISFKLAFVMYSTRNIFYFRCVMLVLCFIDGVVGTIAKFVASSKYHGQNPLKWLPSDGGWSDHVTSTACEWIFSIILMIILSSFALDYRRLKIHHPKIEDRSLTAKLIPTTSEEENQNEANYGSIH